TAARFRIDFAIPSIALGIAASLAGAWFPARGAAQLDPTLALHNIETRKREAVLGWKRLVVGIVLILAGIILIWWSPKYVNVRFQLVYAGLFLLGLTAFLPKIVEWIARLLRPVMNWAGGS